MPRSVLLVEDEPVLAMALEEELLDRGFGVSVVMCGRSAMDALDGLQTIDCLVTDVRLPDVEGWAIARRAREINPDVSVIYITGDSAAQHKAQGVSGSLLLQKPFAFEELAASLGELLG